jgi:hypothetical protein
VPSHNHEWLIPVVSNPEPSDTTPLDINRSINPVGVRPASGTAVLVLGERVTSIVGTRLERSDWCASLLIVIRCALRVVANNPNWVSTQEVDADSRVVGAPARGTHFGPCPR